MRKGVWMEKWALGPAWGSTPCYYFYLEPELGRCASKMRGACNSGYLDEFEAHQSKGKWDGRVHFHFILFFLSYMFPHLSMEIALSCWKSLPTAGHHQSHENNTILLVSISSFSFLTSNTTSTTLNFASKPKKQEP